MVPTRVSELDSSTENSPRCRKGMILAGGTGTRLHPVTLSINKHLLPVYDKPMIYYPLSTLMLAGMDDILLITTPSDRSLFEKLLGNGSQLGIRIRYAVQPEPRGLAEAFLVGEDFIAGQPVALHLGDNILYGHGLQHLLARAATRVKGATLFAYRVKDPSRFGVIEFDRNGKVLSLEEKPKAPRSHYAVIGLYFFDSQAVDRAKCLSLSERGELEILDLIRMYLEKDQLQCELLGRGFAWLDTGTHPSLIQAANFIETLETRQGLKLACIEEIACVKGWISTDALRVLGSEMKNGYGDYLVTRARELESEPTRSIPPG